MLPYSWQFVLAATASSLLLGAAAKRSTIREGRAYCDTSNLRTWIRWAASWRGGFLWLATTHTHYMVAALVIRYAVFLLPLLALFLLDRLLAGFLGAQWSYASSLTAGFLSINTNGKVALGAMTGLLLTPLVFGYIRSATGEEVLDAMDNASDANLVVPRRRWLKWVLRLDTAVCRKTMNVIHKKCTERNRDIVASIPDDRYIDIVWDFASNNRDKLDQTYWARLAIRDAPELARRLHDALKPAPDLLAHKRMVAAMTPLVMQLLIPILGFSEVERQVRDLISPKTHHHPGPVPHRPGSPGLGQADSG